MRTQITLQPLLGKQLVGLRTKAAPVRRQIEEAISNGGQVVLDFEGVEATQSFIDELVGVLVLHHGPEVLQQLVFQKCSTSIKSILEFVTADRADQFSALA